MSSYECEALPGLRHATGEPPMTHQQGPCDLFHDRLDDVTTVPDSDGTPRG